jgi:hypothetical protein
VSKLFSALAAAVVFAGLSQAASVAKPVTVTTPPKPAAKAALVRTPPDAQIQHAIEMKFAKSKINAEHFTASVKNGVAILRGQDERDPAQRCGDENLQKKRRDRRG